MIGNKTSIGDCVFTNGVGVLRVLFIRTITVIYHCTLRKRDKHFNRATSPNGITHRPFHCPSCVFGLFRTCTDKSDEFGDVAVALFTDDTNFITNL